jgi:ActR/RegA family two-component response regulator
VLAQRFDLLLNRALRQRNAVVHGVQTVADVVMSVDAFVARLAGYVVAEAVHGAGAGEDLVEALERARDRSRRILFRLAHEESPVDRVLYGVEEEELGT